MLLWDKLSPWPHVTKQRFLLAKWLAGPPKNSGSKGGWVHTVVLSCEWERETVSSLGGQRLTSTAHGWKYTPSSDPTTHSHYIHPTAWLDVVYHCIFLRVIPTFCGSEYLSLYLQTSLSLFILSVSLYLLSFFPDGGKGMMLVLSCYPPVHMLLLP